VEQELAKVNEGMLEDLGILELVRASVDVVILETTVRTL
jgi:hypothetical protein